MINYEDIKLKLVNFFAKTPFLARFFYWVLDLFILRQWYVKKIIKQFVKPDKIYNILDAGVGLGQYSYFMYKINRANLIKGIDISSEFITILKTIIKKNINFSFNQLDLEKCEIKGMYDFVLLIDVLEHIENDQELLNKLASTLSENGKILISTPTESKNAGYADEHVRNGYTLQALSKKLDWAGLKVLKSEYSYGLCGRMYWYLLMKIPLSVFSAYGFKSLFFLFPYLLVIFPFSLLLMTLDFFLPNPIGEGMILIVEKKE